MCIVSVVTSQMQHQLPPIYQWDLQTSRDVKEILEKLSAIDRKLGAKECSEPEKEKFLAQLAQRVERLEKLQAKR